MKRGLRRAAALLAVLLALVSGAGYVQTAAADTMHREVQNAALEVTAELGYDGVITYGKPFPVRVRIVNNGGDLEGRIAVNAYVSTRQYDRYEMEISVPAGAEKVYVLPVTAQVRQAVFTAEVLRGDEVICAVNAKPGTVANPDAMLIGVLSTRPRQLANLDIDRENDTLSRSEYWQTVALTAETLPDNGELLSAFGLIVLDDVNPSLLTDVQQQALREWIRSGHILLCGGGKAAPRNTAFLADLTGLRTVSVATSDGVVEALENLTGTRKSGDHPEVAVAVIRGGEPMATDSRGNGLLFRTEVETGRIYTMAFEAGDADLNRESLMHIFWQKVMVQWESNRYYSLMGSSVYTPATVNASYTLPVRTSAPLVPALLAAAAVPALGCLLFFLLKRKDRSRWLWGILPVLALAAVAAIFFFAKGSAMNRPMAVSAVNLVQGRDGSVHRYTGIDVAVPRSGQHAFSMEGGTLEKQEEYDYYYYDEEDEVIEPVNLRTVIYSGVQDRVAAFTDQAWEIVGLQEQSLADLGGSMETEIWMEKDGLHGTILNGTAYPMKEGVVMTSFGYVWIPALQPGAGTEFALTEEKDAKNKGEFRSGVLYRSVPGFYTLMDAAANEQKRKGNDLYELQQSMMNGAIDQLSTNSNGKLSVYSENGTSAYLYFAEPEGYRAGALRMDGEEIVTSEEAVLLGTEMNYLPIGRSGVVFHAPGTDPAEQVETTAGGFPTDTVMNTASRYYYTLNETPTFRFAIRDADRITISRLSIGMDTWYSDQARFFLLNAVTKAWDEIQPNQDVMNPAQYVDGNGCLYCQLRGRGSDAYADVPAPSLTLEGGVKDAED